MVQYAGQYTGRKSTGTTWIKLQVSFNDLGTVYKVISSVNRPFFVAVPG